MEACIKMNDIHSGYLIVRRDGHLMMCQRVNQKNFTKIFVNPGRWCYASIYDDELKCKNIINGVRASEYDIMEVYGLISNSENYAESFGLDSLRNSEHKRLRPLLWKRNEVLRLTHKELCILLGKEIEIIPD